MAKRKEDNDNLKLNDSTLDKQGYNELLQKPLEGLTDQSIERAEVKRLIEDATKNLQTTTTSDSIQNSLGTAKGDMIVYTANGTPDNLPVGSNGQVIKADSAATPGVRWDHPTFPSVTDTADVQGPFTIYDPNDSDGSDIDVNTRAAQFHLQDGNLRLVGIPNTGANLYDSSGYRMPDWELTTPITDAWTYVSVSGTVGTVSRTFNSTDTPPVGARVTLVQTSRKYFIVKRNYESAGTWYLELDGMGYYTLANAAITEFNYSLMYCPVGFPLWMAQYPGVLGPAGFGENYKISRTISSDDLVVSLKNLDGEDPSDEKPLRFRVNDTIRWLREARTMTLADGTDWCNLSNGLIDGRDHDLFIYVVWNTTPATDRIDIVASRRPDAVFYGDLSGTSTNQSYGAFSGADTPASTDRLELIGRVNVALNSTQDWSIPATDIVLSRPVFKTRPMVWDPTYTPGGSMTYGTITVSEAYYWIDGSSIYFSHSATGTTGGSADNTIDVGIPWTTPAGAGNTTYACKVQDGTSILGRAVDNAGTVAIRRYDAANFGLGASRILTFSGAARL